MTQARAFVSAILAGGCIGLGGIAYLAIANPIIGALFFTIGLFTICTHGFHLFTGKACYLFDNPPAYALSLIPMWIGNLIGTGIVAYAARATRLTSLLERASTVCTTKLTDNLLSVFILGIFCNILIYIAVEGYNRNPHSIGKYIALFLGVAGFILCGFEHCVANMFYFSFANVWSWHTLLYLVVISFGNLLGAVLLPICKKWAHKQS